MTAEPNDIMDIDEQNIKERNVIDHALGTLCGIPATYPLNSARSEKPPISKTSAIVAEEVCPPFSKA